MLGGMLRSAVLIAVASAAAALWVGGKGLPWIPDVAAVSAQRDADRKRADAAKALNLREAPGVSVSLAELQRLIEQGAVVIDARPRAEFEKAHLLIESDPPVLNVEPGDLDQHLTRLEHVRGMQIVLYCTSLTCDLAEELYAELQAAGFSDVRIFFPGWDGLVKAKLPTTSGADAWTGPAGPSGEPAADEAAGDEGADS